jgi:ABC-type glycerol-3-phosphate transport system permease component
VQENIARYLLNSVIIAVPVTLLTLAWARWALMR